MQTQLFVRAMAIGLAQAARPCAIQHGRYAGGSVMPSIGVDRHPMADDRLPEYLLRLLLQHLHQSRLTLDRHKGLRQQDAPQRIADAGPACQTGGHLRLQQTLDALGLLLGDDATVDAQHHLVGHNIGVDAGLICAVDLDEVMKFNPGFDAESMGAIFPGFVGVVDVDGEGMMTGDRGLEVDTIGNEDEDEDDNDEDEDEDY